MTHEEEIAMLRNAAAKLRLQRDRSRELTRILLREKAEAERRYAGAMKVNAELRQTVTKGVIAFP